MNADTAKPDSTQLAMIRTWMAHERTLMAWVRTATSMISFGFTIYKFFQFEAGRNSTLRKGLLTPRDFALIMISIGLASLLMATVQHHLDWHRLGSQITPRPRPLAEIVAALVSAFGILVLLATIFRS